MRFLRFFGTIGALAVITGCAGPPNREAALSGLNPVPMSAGAWAKAVGTYTGSIRASTIRFGFEGLSETDSRLELSGPVYAPAVLIRMDRGYSTAWSTYKEWKGTFTNITAKRYGSQGTVSATTHAPNQMLIVLRRDGTASHHGSWMVMTFLEDGDIGVDWIGKSGWRGSGEFSRVPDGGRGQ